MKRILTVLAALALLAAPSWAGGAVGAYGSWWDSDDADDSVGGGLLVELGLGSRIDFELRTTFYDDEFLARVGDELARFRATSVRGGLSYNFAPGKLNPYVGGGLDYVMFDLEYENRGRIKDQAGWYGLVGVEFPFGRSFKLFLEGLYTNVKATLKGDDLGFNEVNERIKMGGPALNVGLSLTW